MDGAGKTRKEIRLSLHNNLICPMAYWICGYGSLARIIFQPYSLHSANHILESSNGFHLRHFIRDRQIQNKQCLFFYTTTQFSQYIRRLNSHSTEEPRRSGFFLCIHYENISYSHLKNRIAILPQMTMNAAITAIGIHTDPIGSPNDEAFSSLNKSVPAKAPNRDTVPDTLM